LKCISIAALLSLLVLTWSGSFAVQAQSAPPAGSSAEGGAGNVSFSSSLSGLDKLTPQAHAAALPEAPEPVSGGGGGDEPENVPWAEKVQYGLFARVGIGADISPLGIGIKSATILTQHLDGRMMGNFLSFTTGKFKVEGFDAHANLHLASIAAALDVYPWNSVLRLSAGGLLYNGNQIKMSSEIVPGSSFTLNGTTFFGAEANPATGVTPLNGTGILGFHQHQPALTLSGGFGRYVPRSNRHWSFPAEFGVAFTGAPTIDVHPQGWVCTDKALTQCGNIADPSNPIAVQFNSDLQQTLAKWRRGLSAIQVYPLFSYSVMYSFNTR
ncbi:MAG: hypothetical protein WAN28_03485, partial [Terracidiphilus sp.]